jgi:sortase (surface protein transpeptidase)
LKKIILIVALLASLLILWLNLGTNIVGKNTLTATNISTAIKQNEIQFGIPIRLNIPKLGVTANVEAVALDIKNNMDVPQKVEDVGWYKLGVKPGEKGNAVIDGHYDDVTGAPVVFYNLISLQVGDPIETVDNNGKKLTFIVQKKANYAYNQFPLLEVFGQSNGKNLNLITCSGTWDKNNKTYADRLVIYSTLKE